MNAIPAADSYQELREAVRALCKGFDSAYWQKVDAERGYPEAFVDALTQAGWLAAMIPTEYGGSELGLAEASVIMEEINLSGGNAGACHGQMYNMGTLLRHGSDAQKRAYLPGIASGELRLQSMAVTEPDDRHRYDQAQDDGDPEGRSLSGQRSEGVDLAAAAFRSDDPAGAHHAARRGQAQGRRHERVPGRPARHPWQRQGEEQDDGAADPQHGQSRDQRGVFRRLRSSRRKT